MRTKALREGMVIKGSRFADFERFCPSTCARARGHCALRLGLWSCAGYMGRALVGVCIRVRGIWGGLWFSCGIAVFQWFSASVGGGFSLGGGLSAGL